jgi:hypothetical protein
MNDFQPDLSPVQMLQQGVFGGSYFEMALDDDLLHISPDILELALLNRGGFDKHKNRYAVKAGLHHKVWIRKGWIFPEDPLGWFHWYCRYSSGRRHQRDAHQISRYHSYVRRWGSMARTLKIKSGELSPVVKQGLLQWGIDPDTI